MCSTLPSQEGGDVKKKDAIFQPGEGIISFHSTAGGGWIRKVIAAPTTILQPLSPFFGGDLSGRHEGGSIDIDWGSSIVISSYSSPLFSALLLTQLAKIVEVFLNKVLNCSKLCFSMGDRGGK